MCKKQKDCYDSGGAFCCKECVEKCGDPCCFVNEECESYNIEIKNTFDSEVDII